MAIPIKWWVLVLGFGKVKNLIGFLAQFGGEGFGIFLSEFQSFVLNKAFYVVWPFST